MVHTFDHSKSQINRMDGLWDLPNTHMDTHRDRNNNTGPLKSSGNQKNYKFINYKLYIQESNGYVSCNYKQNATN